MGALPLGERRRRIRPTARGEPGTLAGGALGSGGLPGQPSGGCWLPPPRIPAAGGAVRGAGAEAGAGSASRACPRPTRGCHGGDSITRFGAFHPKSLPPPTDQPAEGCGPSPHKSEPPARAGGAAGRNRRRGRSGGRAEQLVPELRLPSFKLGEFK